MNSNDLIWLANLICGLIMLPFLPVLFLMIFLYELLLSRDPYDSLIQASELWRAWVDLFWEG